MVNGDLERATVGRLFVQEEGTLRGKTGGVLALESQLFALLHEPLSASPPALNAREPVDLRTSNNLAKAISRESAQRTQQTLASQKANGNLRKKATTTTTVLTTRQPL